MDCFLMDVREFKCVKIGGYNKRVKKRSANTTILFSSIRITKYVSSYYYFKSNATQQNREKFTMKLSFRTKYYKS